MFGVAKVSRFGNEFVDFGNGYCTQFFVVRFA
jgi:hypothetical protein